MFLPPFAFYAAPTLKEIKAAEGFVDGQLLRDADWVFWTLTRWEDEAAMKRWRGIGAHGRSMPKLASWCDEASVDRWEMAAGALPTWEECYERMVRDGRRSPVKMPSAGQREFTVAPVAAGRRPVAIVR